MGYSSFCEQSSFARFWLWALSLLQTFLYSVNATLSSLVEAGGLNSHFSEPTLDVPALEESDQEAR